MSGQMNFFESLIHSKKSAQKQKEQASNKSIPITKIVTVNKDEGLPLYFRGNQHLLTLIDFKIETTINIQSPSLTQTSSTSISSSQLRPYLISMPLKLASQQRTDFVEPLVQIETFDQMQRENYLKNKSLVKEGVFYVFYPSNNRVDEKIYKIYSNNFDNFVKDFSKNFRPYFGKLINRDGGKGESSIDSQKTKLNQILSNSLKITIQRKLNNLTSQISNLQSNDPNLKALKGLFILRNKVSSIYKQLRLPANALQHLNSLYYDLLYNYRKMSPPLTTQVTFQKDQTGNKPKPQFSSKLYKSPFIVKNINRVVNYFDTYLNFLQIINFAFLKMFQIQLDLQHHLQAMKRLKHFLDFILSTFMSDINLDNIFNNISTKQDDICRCIWLVEVINESLKILKGKAPPAILNTSKEQEYSLLNVSICSQYRNAIEKIGVIVYGINTYSVFPRNLQYELRLCVRLMKGHKLDDEQYPELGLNQSKQVTDFNKMNFLSGQPVSQTVQLVLNNFNSFKLIYVKTLELMEKTLNQSPYKKVAWSMKLSVLKGTIIYFNLKDQKRMSVNKLLDQDKIFSYDSKKSVWQELQVNTAFIQIQIINKVYRLTLCKRYSIKMSVQDLLNIILDDNIIKLSELWSELTKIVSFLLFEYRSDQSDMNYIDYGQEQEEGVFRRRKTTIHYELKEIQVGTLKYIAEVVKLVNGAGSGAYARSKGRDRWSATKAVDGSLNAHQIQKENINENDNNEKSSIRNNKVRINLQLSNRIISYAVTLVKRSKEMSQEASEEASREKAQSLISLKFKIKTSKNEEKFIPFEIIDTDDKFIEVQVSEPTQDVLIFKIQQLLININNNIKLVYVMPLNHEKLETYGHDTNEQLDANEETYANISPQFSLNVLFCDYEYIDRYFRLPQNQPFSKSKLIECVNDSQGQHEQQQQSQKLSDWSGHQSTVIQNIQINCDDEIFESIYIGNQEIKHKVENINFNISQKFKKDGGQQSLIVFVKTQTQSQRPRKGSVFNKSQQMSLASQNVESNAFPSGIAGGRSRSRQNSTARSYKSSGTGFSADSAGNKLNICLHVAHSSYEYKVESSIVYTKRRPFKIDYKYAENLQQYTITNLCRQELKMQSQGEDYLICQNQQLKVFSPNITIGFQEMEKYVAKLGMDQKVNLKSMVKKQFLKPQQVSTIWIDLFQDEENFNRQKDCFKLFKPITVRCGEDGLISLLKTDSSSYEVLGKIEGAVQYLDSQDKQLDLYILPTRKGHIVLPELSINQKKALWRKNVIKVT